MEKLENKKVKLCTKDRDIIAGFTFERTVIMDLFADRCSRLVVIISTNFLKSPANQFLLTFAQTVGIEKQQRKLIACIYEECKLPLDLCYIKNVCYSRRGLYDFWGHFLTSVITPSRSNSKMPCVQYL